jgi:cytochrome b561
MSEATVYNPLARALHWWLVLLIAAEFALAWLMPDIHRGTQPEALIAWHIGLGTTILALMALRIVWRLIGGAPAMLPAPRWQHRAAHAVHGLLYLGFIALPLLGWANASARGWSVHLAGLLQLPALAAQGAGWAREAGDVHQVVAYGLLGAIGLHVLAALQHQFILRDKLIARMWPRRS